MIKNLQSSKESNEERLQLILKLLHTQYPKYKFFIQIDTHLKCPSMYTVICRVGKQISYPILTVNWKEFINEVRVLLTNNIYDN